MGRNFIATVPGFCLGFVLSLFTPLSVAETSNNSSTAIKSVPVISVKGAIGPAVGAYIIEEIQRANQASNTPALIMTIDTPGGLVSSLRAINQQILSSDIPVLCLVYPQGARAASAGTYMLYACHIAAMSSATTLGAATPVSIGSPAGSDNQQQEKPTEPSAMEKKMLNDSIAYIRSLAQLRGRNVEWAEKAVREAATLSSSEALELNVINLIAEDPLSLLSLTHGQTVSINKQQISMDFADTTLEMREPDWRNQFLATITDPNIAYILMIIGIYGLLLEFYSPGFGVSGIAGAISLLLALYAFQLLPVNYAGLGLILLGLALLVAESMLPSFGLLGFGGVVAFTLGSVFLFDSELPELRISLSLIYAIAATSALFVLFVLRRIWLFRKRKAVSGPDTFLGSEAVVTADFSSKGIVLIRGEEWAAISDSKLEKGDIVTVTAVNGLTLTVIKADGSNRP
ncbi:NfeD family protein [Vibrio sp. SCSIO 43137]|uniref:NfeD family protein n=1 Tax=Vibrio sp. SCSIO 43137 TaxID=3021011 RepID=UPI002307CA11|nr:nodulation protein NfeD [Vibrio sp. SCSIO 43137]WCE30739.1 nodulation protein NfeD [Vibrio sp. SCSIO 43137]